MKYFKKTCIYLLILIILITGRYLFLNKILNNNKYTGTNYYEKRKEVDYFVYDLNENKVVEENKLTNTVNIHELARLFTIYYALKNLDLSSDVELSTDEKVQKSFRNSIGLANQKISVKNLIKVALVGDTDDGLYYLSKATLEKILGEKVDETNFLEKFKKSINDFYSKLNIDVNIIDPLGKSEENKVTMEALKQLMNKDTLFNEKFKKLYDDILYSEPSIKDKEGKEYKLIANNNFSNTDKNSGHEMWDLCYGNSYIRRYKIRKFDMVVFVNGRSKEEAKEYVIDICLKHLNDYSYNEQK